MKQLAEDRNKGQTIQWGGHKAVVGKVVKFSHKLYRIRVSRNVVKDSKISSLLEELQKALDVGKGDLE